MKNLKDIIKEAIRDELKLVPQWRYETNFLYERRIVDTPAMARLKVLIMDEEGFVHRHVDTKQMMKIGKTIETTLGISDCASVSDNKMTMWWLDTNAIAIAEYFIGGKHSLSEVLEHRQEWIGRKVVTITTGGYLLRSGGKTVKEVEAEILDITKSNYSDEINIELRPTDSAISIEDCYMGDSWDTFSISGLPFEPITKLLKVER